MMAEQVEANKHFLMIKIFIVIFLQIYRLYRRQRITRH